MAMRGGKPRPSHELPDEMFETLRKRIAWEREKYNEAKDVGWEDMIRGQIFGMFSFLGDAHGPDPTEIDACVQMYGISYWQASLYREDCPWAMEGYVKFVEGQEEELNEREDIDELIPSFENWFLNRYRRAWVSMMKSKLTYLINISQTFAERREQRLEATAAISSMQGATVAGKGGAVSTLATGGAGFEETSAPDATFGPPKEIPDLEEDE